MPIPVNALAIMAKAPLAGMVKTRLAPPLSHEQAAAFARALLLDQLDQLKNFPAARYLVYTPAHAEPLMRELGGSDYQYLCQSGDDLGARMQRAFVDLSGRGHRHIALIGGDLAPLPERFLTLAYAELARSERQVVLGPSEDGGYYLVGMNRPTPEIFTNMSWSHDRVLAQTTERLTALGIPFALLPSWFDIDTIDDLRRLPSRFDRVARRSMARTLRYLAGLDCLGDFAVGE